MSAWLRRRPATRTTRMSRTRLSALTTKTNRRPPCSEPGDYPARHYTRLTMSRSLVERRLIDVHARLKEARAELIVLDEQLAVLSEAAEDARIRSLVSETPAADREHRDARRHAEALARSRDALKASIAELESAQDRLLGRLP